MITRSSVDELAAQGSSYDDETLEAVAEEIEQDQKLQKLAAASAEESFKDRVIAIAKKYGPATLLVVAGVAGELVFPGAGLGAAVLTTLLAASIKRISNR
jgi:hypothetical protein